MQIRQDDLTGPEIHALLEEHLQHMRAVSPPESVHALDLAKLRQPAITFWTVWAGDSLMGCGALKQLNAQHGEIKSMRTAMAARGIGLGRRLLEHAIEQATESGCEAILLETGSEPHFEAARGLYLARGFTPCPPFAEYTDDPSSVYLRLEVVAEAPTATT